MAQWAWDLLSQASSSSADQPSFCPSPHPTLTLPPTPAHWIRADIQIPEFSVSSQSSVFKIKSLTFLCFSISVLIVFHKNP